MQTQWEPKGNNAHTMGRKRNERATVAQTGFFPDRDGGTPLSPPSKPKGHIGQTMGRKTQLKINGTTKKKNANAMGAQGKQWIHHEKERQWKSNGIPTGFYPDRAGGHSIVCPLFPLGPHCVCIIFL